MGGLLLAALGGLAVDIPAALLFGVSISSSNLPGGLEIADTVVQDAMFVLSAVLFAKVGARTVRAWQFGLQRPGIGWLSPRVGWLWAVGMILVTLFTFLVFSVAWAEILNVHSKEKLLEQLGANEGTSLLLLSAGLTCVVAPICEEFLFRGFIFRALYNWRGMWPAAVITGPDLRRDPRGLGAGGRSDAAGGPGVRAVRALPLHRLAVPVHRGALAEQLPRLRGHGELGVADTGAGGRALAVIALLVAGAAPRRRDHRPARAGVAQASTGV